MIELAHPWAFVLLPLPLLVWWLSPPHRERISALRVPFFDVIADASGETPRGGATVIRRRPLQVMAALLIWLCLVAAVAKPEWLDPPIEKTEAARDVILAADISGSMDQNDFAVTGGQPMQRLAAVKSVVGQFIKDREGDRLALIIFGSKAYVQVPFIQDLETARALLEAIEVGMAGPHTALGDAIGLAIQTFKASEIEQRLLILLTDGSDTGSRMTPLNAAKIAAQNRVEIFTIGVGDPEGQAEDRVDFETLEQIATSANGKFFTAGSAEALASVYARIDDLVPRETKTVSYRPRRALVHWPAGAAVIIAILGYVLLLISIRRPPQAR